MRQASTLVRGIENIDNVTLSSLTQPLNTTSNLEFRQDIVLKVVSLEPPL